MTHVTSNRKQSNSGFNRSGGNRSNRAHWWMRRDNEFISLPDRVRGDSRIDIEMDLKPGEYTLGVGTGKDAIRETHTVTEEGEWI